VANSNYSITYTADSLSITPLAVIVTADGKTKIYGEVDPLLTYVSNPSVGFMLPNGLMVGFSGVLIRDSGEVVGEYPIRLGSIANSNYTINYISDSLEITPLAILVTADAQVKVYGDDDPLLTYVSVPAVGDTLTNGDVISFSGSLDRAPGESVGNYTIQLGSLVNANYAITFASDLLTINSLAVTVSANVMTKVYGDPDPVFTFTSVPAVGDILSNGQVIGFNGQLERTTGELIGTYGISQGSLNNPNYTINFDSASLVITKRVVTITTDSGQFKVYGDPDPVLTYTVSNNGIAPFDEFAGFLGRDTGEIVAVYPINIGSLTIVNKSNQASAMNNYDFNFIPADFTIIPAYSTTILLRGKPDVYYRDSVNLTAIIRPMNNQSPLSGRVEFQIGGLSYGFVQATQIPDSAIGILQASLPRGSVRMDQRPVF